MKTLLLGGTGWLGSTTAAVARDRGHDVTCLARGETGSAPAGVRFVQADRDQEDAYDAVRGEDWDHVVEVSWQPGMVRTALEALGSRARHWSYVPSCSVYAGQDTPGADESAPTLLPLTTDRAERSEYGEAKAACERLTLKALGERALIEAGVIGGFGDVGDRLGYWPARFSASVGGAGGWRPGDPVLVPDAPRMATQVINVEDLADWLIHCGENRVTGVFNASGELVAFEDLIAACRRITGADAPIVSASGAWLVDQGIEELAGEKSLPLWIHDPAGAGFSQRDTSAAVAAGLTWRPIDHLVDAALRWEIFRGLERDRKAGLTPAEERELISEWVSQ